MNTPTPVPVVDAAAQAPRPQYTLTIVRPLTEALLERVAQIAIVTATTGSRTWRPSRARPRAGWASLLLDGVELAREPLLPCLIQLTEDRQVPTVHTVSYNTIYLGLQRILRPGVDLHLHGDTWDVIDQVFYVVHQRDVQWLEPMTADYILQLGLFDQVIYT